MGRDMGPILEELEQLREENNRLKKEIQRWEEISKQQSLQNHRLMDTLQQMREKNNPFDEVAQNEEPDNASTE